MEIEWEERPFILYMEDALKPDAPKIMPEVARKSIFIARAQEWL
jgi:hypothetical protein